MQAERGKIRSSRLFFLVVLTIWLPILTSLDGQAALGSPAYHGGRARYFCGRGKVVSLDRDRNGITIKHERIEGFMGAMTMHFQTEEPDVSNGIKAGDSIRFTLKDTPNETSIVYMEIIGNGEASQ